MSACGSTSIVCQDPKTCELELVAGMGGTPLHRTSDMIVVPSMDEVEAWLTAGESA